MLEVRNLTKRFRGTLAVDNVSFSLTDGEILGYVGPNGSGKSTTVKMLTGLLEPSSGQIFYNDVDTRKDLVAFKSRLGYVPEEPHLYTHLSGLEYLMLIGRLRGLRPRIVKGKVEEMLHLFELHEARFTLMTGYSKGMRQRVLIAAALLADPELLILDEPFSGLDLNAALLLRHLLREFASSGRMILFSSHVLEVVEKVCSRVVILYKGRVAAQDSIAHLRDLLKLPSLEDVFSQLTTQRDYLGQAKRIVEVIGQQ